MDINSTSGGERLLDAGSRKWVGYNQLLTCYKQRMLGLACHVALWEDTIDSLFFRPIYGNYEQFYFNSQTLKHVSRLPLQNPSRLNSHIFASLTLFFHKREKKKSNKECHHLLAICTEYDLHTVQPDPIYYTWRGRMFIYVCVSEWGQLFNKEGEKKQQQHCSVSLGSVGERSSSVFTVKHSIPGLREDDQRFSAAPRRPASRSADISLFFPLAFISSTTTQIRGTERRSSRRKCGRERRRQEIWFPSECALQKTVLCNVGKAWWK